MLAALAPRDARAAALPARRPRRRPQVRAHRRASTACPSRPSPTRRTCASSPAPGARPFLARHGGLRRAPGRHRRRAPGRVVGPPPRRAPLHRRPAPRPRGRRRRRAALRAAHRRARQHRHRRAARGAGHDRRPRRATRACTRRPAEVDAVKLRYRSPAGALHAARRRRSSSPSRSTAPPRARPRCFLRGDAVAGMRHNRCVTVRRDPRDLPRLLRGARPPAPARRPRSCPASYDPSVLLTTAGMHPLKPYFLGHREAAAHRADDAARSASARPTSRTSATPTRHLTFFEMLGNFSIGDYFKQGAVEFALGAVARGLRLQPRATSGSRSSRATTSSASAPTRRPSRPGRRSASRATRIVLLPARGELLAGRADRPVRAVQRAVPRPRPGVGRRPTTCPGGENERFLEYWNLVFMQYDQDPIGTLTPLPAKNIDTGLGLNRMALIQQGVDVDLRDRPVPPLMTLGRELADAASPTSARCASSPTTRAAMTFLIADGVVPSNEDRGYILRRDHAPRDPAGPPHRHRARLPAAVRRASSSTLMGAALPGAAWPQRETIHKWVRAEEEGFGRTLEQGTQLLDDLLAARRGHRAPTPSACTTPTASRSS